MDNFEITADGTIQSLKAFSCPVPFSACSIVQYSWLNLSLVDNKFANTPKEVGGCGHTSNLKQAQQSFDHRSKHVQGY